MDITQQLQQVGFTVYESKIINVILLTQDPTAKDIAQVSEVPKNKVYEVLEHLGAQGVVEILPVKPKRFRVLDLKQSIRDREKVRAQQYLSAQKQVESLLAQVGKKPDTKQDIWVSEGKKAMLGKVAEILVGLQKESIAYVDVWAGGPENYRAVSDAIGRGVKFYFLGKVDKKSLPIIKTYIELGVEVREYPVEAAGYSIFDTTDVQMRISSSRVISLWLHNKYLATILREHFFANWKKAKKVKL